MKGKEVYFKSKQCHFNRWQLSLCVRFRVSIAKKHFSKKNPGISSIVSHLALRSHDSGVHLHLPVRALHQQVAVPAAFADLLNTDVKA